MGVFRNDMPQRIVEIPDTWLSAVQIDGAVAPEDIIYVSERVNIRAAQSAGYGQP